MPSSPLVAAFTFHEVCDDPRSSGLQRPAAMPYKHSLAAFRATLDAIASAEFAPTILPPTPTGRNLVLTFDDGGASAITAAAELAHRGWHGYFFVVSDFIGKPGFLDRAAIADLHKAGHVVGNHSTTHPDIFRNLTPTQMREEFRICRDRLEQITGAPCLTASVPGGDSSDEVYCAATDIGIRQLFTSEPTPTPILSGTSSGACWIFGRANVKATTAPAHCAKLAQFSGWPRDLAVYRTKQALRQVLAPLYRAYVAYSTRPFAQGS